jgi:hypothetical protein
MENLYVDVKIKIRPYLKQFISSNREVEPFFTVSPTKCHFSSIFLEPLKKDMIKVGESEHKFLTDEIVLRMSPTVMREGKFWWDANTVLLIDKRLKSLFDQQLVDFIMMLTQQKGDIKVSIACFMNYYQISEDMISLETLVKMYYRARFYVPPAKKEKIESAYAQLQLFA